MLVTPATAVWVLSCLFALVITEPAGAQERRRAKQLRQRRAAPATRPLQPGAPGFFDAHVHLNDPQMQLRLMAEAGNTRAVVFWGARSTNELLVKLAKEHPERFVPFASVSPERQRYRRDWEAADRKILDILAEQLRTGVFRGIGEISVAHYPATGFPEADFDPMHPIMRGIMELAQKHELPINIHCEITRLREFEQLLRAYPKVAVIWAHGGYTPYFLAKRLLSDHPNLYYELSTRTWTDHPRSPDYTILKNETDVWPRWLSLIEDRADRFLIGTDASHHDIDREREKIRSVQNLLEQLSEEARKKVAFANLERLLDS